MKQKLMVIVSRIPYPLEKGDKLRAYHQIKLLSNDFDVYLFALHSESVHPDAFNELKLFCKAVYFLPLSKLSIAYNLMRAFVKKLPMQVGYFYNSKHSRFINKKIREIQPDYLYAQLIRTAEYFKNQEVPATIDYMDALSVGMKRRSEKAKWFYRWIYNFESKRLFNYENEIFSAFKNHSIISESDLMQMKLPRKEAVVVIKNGVDFTFFSPSKSDKKFDLVFTGNMSYPPNILAANYLCNEIMPLVWEKYPATTLLISGANPPASLLKLNSDKIEVTGWVNDMRESYAKSRIFIAPMQIGTGLQNKLLEAMAMQLPCVCSQLANNALKAKENKEVLLAESSKEFANAVFYLLENKAFAEEIAKNGYEYILTNYSWESSVLELRKLILS